MLARYRGKTICPDCNGLRLKKEATWVKVGEKSITELINMPVSEIKTFFDKVKLPEKESKIAGRLLAENSCQVLTSPSGTG